MERLNFVGDSSPFFNIDGKKEKKSKKSKAQKGRLFTGSLSNAEKQEEEWSIREALGLEGAEPVTPEETLDAVHDLGERLKKNPTIALIKDYRKAVGSFIRYVVKHGFVTEKHRLRGFKLLKLPQGAQPELTVIQIVDTKLDELAHTVLQNQKDQLEILRRIDEIYGILIDVTT